MTYSFHLSVLLKGGQPMAVKIITMEIASIYKVGKLRENASAASLAVKGKKEDIHQRPS